MANKVYVNPETPIVFAPATATVSNVTFEVDALANGAGYQSAQHDLGTAPRSRMFAWRAFTQCQLTPVVGNIIRVYLKTSDGTYADNDDGTGDLAVSAENKLKNLKYIGAIIVDEAAANIPFVASGLVSITSRYVQVVFWNASGATLTTDVNEHGFILQAIPDEIQ